MIVYSVKTETDLHESENILNINDLVKQYKKNNINFSIFRSKNGKVKPLAINTFNVYCSNARLNKTENDPNVESKFDIQDYTTKILIPKEEPTLFAVSVASDALCNKFRGLGHLDVVECYKSNNEIIFRVKIDSQEHKEVLPLNYNVEELEETINKFNYE